MQGIVSRIFCCKSETFDDEDAFIEETMPSYGAVDEYSGSVAPVDRVHVLLGVFVDYLNYERETFVSFLKEKADRLVVDIEDKCVGLYLSLHDVIHRKSLRKDYTAHER